ncbi:hypothetical protein NE237_009702 [Protea cynaroides]|uniref:Uncharacterized protein n=1 Tax=Protea cynaroides TaxID=273540 RepID=A0A9Q0KXX4_9MAGN|nr:hypothetical protein NE237_009702 [Protea cynaroides]
MDLGGFLGLPNEDSNNVRRFADAAGGTGIEDFRVTSTTRHLNQVNDGGRRAPKKKRRWTVKEKGKTIVNSEAGQSNSAGDNVTQGPVDAANIEGGVGSMYSKEVVTPLLRWLLDRGNQEKSTGSEGGVEARIDAVHEMHSVASEGFPIDLNSSRVTQVQDAWADVTDGEEGEIHPLEEEHPNNGGGDISKEHPISTQTVAVNVGYEKEAETVRQGSSSLQINLSTELDLVTVDFGDVRAVDDELAGGDGEFTEVHRKTPGRLAGKGKNGGCLIFEGN